VITGRSVAPLRDKRDTSERVFRLLRRSRPICGTPAVRYPDEVGGMVRNPLCHRARSRAIVELAFARRMEHRGRGYANACGNDRREPGRGMLRTCTKLKVEQLDGSNRFAKKSADGKEQLRRGQSRPRKDAKPLRAAVRILAVRHVGKSVAAGAGTAT